MKTSKLAAHNETFHGSPDPATRSRLVVMPPLCSGGAMKRRSDTTMMGINSKMCRRAAQSLWSAFSWDESKEGEKYWQKIYERLLEIADKGEKR